MAYNKKKKIYILIFLSSIIILTCILVTKKVDKKNLESLYKPEYTAIIIDTFRLKQVFIKYINIETRDTMEMYPSSELLSKSSITDTFYKIKNSNKCIIKKDTIKCYGLDFSILSK